MSTHCFILICLGGFILKITDKIEALSENILSENGLELVDIEFKKKVTTRS